MSNTTSKPKRVTKKSRIQAELRELAGKHHGLLKPSIVVAFARANRKSALHTQFEWDNNKAAAAYRLYQARELIRCSVLLMPGTDAPVRAYVSLSDDRWGGSGGGYRPISEIMSNTAWRERMLADALADLQVFREKYLILKALKPVFRAADKVEAAATKKKPRRGR